MKTRIVLVDDHRMFREGLGALFDKRPDMEICGSAGDGREALTVIRELVPNVVLMDVGMPEMNGIEATRQIREELPDIPVVALSARAEHQLVIEMLRAGASGYVLKNSPFTELLDSIAAVQNGRIFISSALSGPLVMEFVHKTVTGAPSAFSILTSRELEILQAIAEGKSTKEIASLLLISIKTVETHRQQIMEKLKIYSVAELTKYAIREAITSV